MLMFTAGGLLLVGVFALAGFESAVRVALVAVAVLPLLPLLAEMWKKLRSRQPGVDVIALLAVVASLTLGELLTAAIIGLMLATGQFLEDYAAGRAQRELTALVDRAPKMAHRLVDGKIETVDVADISPGDRLMIKSGEVIPVDGVVVGSVATIDESALTGEPLPVERVEGDLVASGCVNASDLFEIRVTRNAAASTYAGIIRLVEEARGSRAPAVRLADQWAGWFVPVALIASGLAWAVSGDPVRGLAVLVVATPCPLLLAVPIAIVSGISRGAKRGVIFRGGGALETLAQTKNLVIDKTGTVTVGMPVVRSIHVFDGALTEEELLSLAASVDQVSSHVLARSLVDAAHERGAKIEVPSEVNDVHGSGVVAKLGDGEVAVGKLSWLLGGAPESGAVKAFRRSVSGVSPTVVYVGVEGQVVGAIVFDDRVRADAGRTIRALRAKGVGRVVMATGDLPVVARSVGMSIGVDDVLAEATPEEKVKVLSDLQRSGTTAMVGDGINDAPALAAADVGVAMGARGATASSEAADVVLVVDRLDALVDAMGIAQRSRRIAVESVVVGMGLSLVAMTAAGFGLLVPLAGALLQEAIDLVAIANALRALHDTRSLRGDVSLPPELASDLSEEHARLIPQLDRLRRVADDLDYRPAGEAVESLHEVRDFLVDEILPHEADDEARVYPALSELLPGSDPMMVMSRGHREIFHLIESFRRQVDVVTDNGLSPADIRDLRRTLYGLHAVLTLHFDQEEDLYSSLGSR